MDDELETLLRGHYRRGADEIHAGPALVHRLQRAAGDAPGRAARPGWRARIRHWTLPLLAGALTAAVIAAVAVILWPGAERSPSPRPMAPPSPPSSTPSAPFRGPSPVEPTPSGLPSPSPIPTATTPPAGPPPSSTPAPGAVPTQTPPAGVTPPPTPAPTRRPSG